MPALTSILRLLEQLDSTERTMPATFLYGEGWLLRLVLDAGARGYLPTIMAKDASWFSEAQLYTPFGRERLSKKKGAKYESNTRADGVVGDFSGIESTKSGLEINADARRFVALEAKMYSVLSSGTTNAKGYDQAARYIACIAETLRRSNCQVDTMETIGFYVVAPQSQIERGVFTAPTSAESIRLRVAERIQQFDGVKRDELSRWQEQWFFPLVSKMESAGTLRCISWETLIQEISEEHAETGKEIEGFYEKCKQYNQPSSQLTETATRTTRGKEYVVMAGSHKDQRVRVVGVGEKNSRVYVEGRRGETFLVANPHLQLVPEEEQTPPPPDPIGGREYVWTGAREALVKVRVRNVGNYNSRVVRLDAPDAESFKVPNHQLSDSDRE